VNCKGAPHFCWMFDFEKLQVYQKAKEYNLHVKKEILSIKAVDKSAKDQLRRAAMSIMLNIAEGTTRFINTDKRNFYVISRGKVLECVAINDVLESKL
jgi:four helix bundle protein